MVIILDGGGGDCDESVNFGVREAFVGGGGRRNDRCVSRSVVLRIQGGWMTDASLEARWSE